MTRGDAVTWIGRDADREAAGRVAASARLVVLVLAIAAVAPACATKRDVRVLTDEIAELRRQQDTLVEQNRALVELIRSTSEQLVRVQGTLGNQLLELQRQLVQVQELTGQSHVEIARLYDRIEQNRAMLEAPMIPGPPTDDDVAVLYESGVEMLGRGNIGTARRAFEQIVNEFPNHPLAPDAQYQLAETYLQDNPPDRDRALQELERVVQRYPDSPRAPAALYRAGVVAEERGDRSRAMQYYNRVIGAYPGSDEERLARARLGS